MDVRVDDLTHPATIALIAAHLDGMHADSPAESVHALGLDALRAPGVTFWSAWIDGELAGIVALTTLDATHGELKSMRVADAFLGRGVGRALLRHVVAHARTAGITRLSLETGSTASFAPALALYASEGFAPCPPFADYTDDPFSVFLTREL